MNKFKVGQRVRVTSMTGSFTGTADRRYIYIGAVFTISNIVSFDRRYRQDKYRTWCDEQDLTAINPIIHTRILK